MKIKFEQFAELVANEAKKFVKEYQDEELEERLYLGIKNATCFHDIINILMDNLFIDDPTTFMLDCIID
jgi:hypothetical protein